MKRDGHIHSHFCPHGTSDPLRQYVERAIELGFKEISFTEHAPLPDNFTDPTPTKDSAMESDKLTQYFYEVNKLKEDYREDIKINTGLEVDYIEDFEEEITNFLNSIGEFLDDAILSVHFLKFKNNYDCVDYSPQEFEKMIENYGSIEAIHENYYRTVLKSINSNLGKYKPKRIGHITLVNKFKNRFPVKRSFHNEIEEILLAVKKASYELDYNGAGTAKPLCREPYPNNDIIKLANQLNIKLVYGSDAHQVKELGQGREQMIFLKI